MSYLKRKSTQKLIFSLILSLVLLVISTHTDWLKQSAKTAQQNQPGLYSIDHFIDGDTIAVNMNGKIETIRMIGVDTPETHKPNTPVQCYGENAAGFTKRTIGNQSVRLQADPLDTNRDVYGRLLRYVYLPSGTLLDEQLIRQGYGFAYLDFPFSKKTEFAAAQQAAQNAKLGLWASCQPTKNKYGGYTSNPA